MFVLFAGVELRIGHLLFTSVFATSLVLLLILVRVLDYPCLREHWRWAIATLSRQLSALARCLVPYNEWAASTAPTEAGRAGAAVKVQMPLILKGAWAQPNGQEPPGRQSPLIWLTF
jgi:hypothetical protein